MDMQYSVHTVSRIGKQDFRQLGARAGQVYLRENVHDNNSLCVGIVTNLLHMITITS